MISKTKKFTSNLLERFPSPLHNNGLFPHLGNNYLAYFFSFVLTSFVNFEFYHLFGSQEDKTKIMKFMEGKSRSKK